MTTVWDIHGAPGLVKKHAKELHDILNNANTIWNCDDLKKQHQLAYELSQNNRPKFQFEKSKDTKILKIRSFGLINLGQSTRNNGDIEGIGNLIEMIDKVNADWSPHNIYGIGRTYDEDQKWLIQSLANMAWFLEYVLIRPRTKLPRTRNHAKCIIFIDRFAVGKCTQDMKNKTIEERVDETMKHFLFDMWHSANNPTGPKNVVVKHNFVMAREHYTDTKFPVREGAINTVENYPNSMVQGLRPQPLESLIEGHFGNGLDLKFTRSKSEGAETIFETDAWHSEKIIAYDIIQRKIVEDINYAT